MSNDEILTDDYVAGLLSQEAKDCSLKYSALGMEAYRTEKKPANMLKPNTRFLRHIIKDTDTHNKALLAKEAAESRARLKDLERSEEIKRLKTNPNSRDIRRRQMGDIHAILGGKKRQRTEDDATASSSRDSKKRESSRKSDQSQDLFECQNDDRRHRGRLSRADDRRERSNDRSERHSRSRREEKRRKSQSRDSEPEEERRHRHRRRRDRSRDRSRSPERRRRSRSPRDEKSRRRHRSPVEDRKGKSRRDVNERDDDSDPLEDLIGPAPPPKYRGRGTVGGSSGIDRRFSDNYDPKTDIQMEDEDGNGDWDDAVEAFRDRQKLKQNQEQRMKAAGFADDLIKRANTTDEKLSDSVQWTRAGEKREWDRGKVVDSDGDVDVDDEL